MSRLDQTVKPDGVEDADNGTGVLIEQEHLELFHGVVGVRKVAKL
jgi:hypothetical protein